MIAGLVMAGGKGSRILNDKPKPLCDVAGRNLIDYIYESLDNCIEDVYTIYSDKTSSLKEVYKNRLFIKQNKLNGTGGAVIDALDEIKQYKHILIAPCDMPLISEDTIRKLIETHLKNDNNVTLLSSIIDNPFGFGRVKREPLKIIEQNELKEDIGEVNVGIYIFKIKELKQSLLKINYHSEELYLTDVISQISSKSSVIQINKKEVYGVNTNINLLKINDIFYKKNIKKLQKKGVTFLCDKTTKISHNTQVGKNVVIKSNTIIHSNTIIGNNVIIGPFSNIRKNVIIEDNCNIGSFVELKCVKLGNNVKIPHHTYLGDCEVGDNTNIGCGVITCNFDGVKKNKTIIGKNTFIGANSTLIAPVSIGDNVLIAAGSTITKDVLDNKLASSRIPQKSIVNRLIKK